MKSLILVLSLCLGTDVGGQEAMLERLNRLDRQLDVLLLVYDELSACRDVACMNNIKHKYIEHGSFPYDEITLGSKNTILDLKLQTLKRLVISYKKKVKEDLQDKVSADKLKMYEMQYKELREHPGYD